MSIPVIIDLSPGEEALVPLGLLSSSPAFEIKAITLSPQPEGAEELQRLKDQIASLGVKAPVAGGGELSSVSLMSRVIDDGGAPAILAWGPLSNVAALLLTRPEAAAGIRCLSFAGGSLRGGDATVAAEQNVFADPEALDVVLRSGVKTFMAPLELNEALARLGPWQKFRGNRGRILRDLCAALVSAEPGLFQVRELYLETELSGEFSRGSTVADLKGQLERKNNVSILEAFDAQGLSTILTELFDACGQEGTL